MSATTSLASIYLAARYSRREELCGYRTDLERAGFTVTSRWLNGEHQITDAGMAAPAEPDDVAAWEGNVREHHGTVGEHMHGMCGHGHARGHCVQTYGARPGSLGKVGEALVEDDTNQTEDAVALRTRFAQEDWADLLAADIVVSFTETPRSSNSRGGRHVEFGAGLALGKPCLVVGPRENVFHCLPDVVVHEHWWQALAGLLTREVQRLQGQQRADLNAVAGARGADAIGRLR
jgi:hypothetical protein